MTAILDGRDSVVVLPTGSGKSLCFQAPALVAPQDQSRRLAIVVSPLIALMKDQVDGLREAGVPARCLNSAQSSGERADAMQAIRSGECRLLYVSPERLVGDGGEAFRRMLGQAGVRFVAVDEAHCISQWGQISAPSIVCSEQVESDFPARVLSRVHRHGYGPCPPRHRRAAGAAEPVGPRRTVDRPNLTIVYCRATRCGRNSTRARASPRRGRDHLLPVPHAKWTSSPPHSQEPAFARSPITPVCPTMSDMRIKERFSTSERM